MVDNTAEEFRNLRDAEQLTREFSAVAEGFPTAVVMYALGVTLARGLGAKKRSDVEKTFAFLRTMIEAEFAAMDEAKRLDEEFG